MADSMTTEQKIAHFLKLAEDTGATQAERDTASARAEALMIRHGITRAMAEAHGQKVKEQIVTESKMFAGAYADARMMLAHSIALALDLRMYKQGNARGEDYVSGKRANGTRVTIVGFESDVRDAWTLIASIDVQAAVSVKEWAKDNLDSWYDTNEKTRRRRIYIESFGRGAASRVKEMYRVAVQEAEHESSGSALVLADKKQQVNNFYADLGLSKGRARTSYHSTAGYSAGQNANVGGKGIGAGQRALVR